MLGSDLLRDSEERDRFIYIVESSLKVHKPSHFFAWTQGPLQGLLPHEIMVCGLAAGPGRELRLRYFTATRYFRPEHFEAATNPRHGLLTRIIRHWARTRSPCLIPTPPEHEPCEADWSEQLHRLELRSMAAHGLHSGNGHTLAWFGLFRVGRPSTRTARLLELLLPTITAAYARSSGQADAGSADTTAVQPLLTRRELQVLELVRAGLTTTEIAAQLSLSAVTAKNHIQNIRRKLGVHTRGQAVAEAQRLGLLD